MLRGCTSLYPVQWRCVVPRVHCMQSCTVYTLCGVVLTGGIYARIVQVYSKLAEGVERMSWLQRYLPSSMAQGISDRLAGASQWARRLSGEKGASQSSQVCGGHHYKQLLTLVPSLPTPHPSLPSLLFRTARGLPIGDQRSVPVLVRGDWRRTTVPCRSEVPA